MRPPDVGDGDLGARRAPRRVQPRDEIGRRERRVGGETGDVRQATRRRMRAIVEARQNPGERTGETRRVVGEDGQAEAGEARRIAVGAERERPRIAAAAAR